MTIYDPFGPGPRPSEPLPDHPVPAPPENPIPVPPIDPITPPVGSLDPSLESDKKSDIATESI